MTGLTSLPESRPEGSAPIRIILLCVALIAIAVAIHFTPIEAWLADAHQLRRGALAGFGNILSPC